MLDRTFIDELASKAPTPGGGGAAAYVGALAVALSSMIGNLTTGKKSYAAVEDQVQAHLLICAELQDVLLEQIDADARAFQPLSDAYRMPKETPVELQAKHAAIQAALLEACLVPLNIMRLCDQVLDEAHFFAHNGSKLATSDAGASAVLAHAALEAASLNVYINTASMEDKLLAEHLEAQADELRAVAASKALQLNEFVFSAIRK